MKLKRTNASVLGICALLVMAFLTSGCATNPATGKSQIMLISEQQEIAIGREEDEKVSKSIGLYDDAELQDYVSRIGMRLARTSERPDLPWSFKVVDDPVVNAFALPGGYIYITRGILAQLGSEAQLATVLGHEIGHVTARHSANQISKAQLASIGVGVGAAVATGAGLPVGGDLMQAGTGLLFLKFSRDDERQADELGLRYGQRNGYDMREASEVHRTLERTSQLSQEGGRVPGWLSTHPQSENRIERIEAELSRMDHDFDGATVERRGFLRQVDGIVWGPNPREGYFEDDTFYHPDLAFQMDFPNGWKGVNQRDSVGAISKSEDAVVVLRLSKHTDLRTAAREFVRETEVSSTQPSNGQFNGLPATWLGFEGVVGQASITGRAAWVSHGGQTFELLGYSLSDRWDRYQGTVDRSLQSFSRLTNKKVLQIQPARVEVIELPGAMTLREFQQAYPSSISLQRLAVLNQVSENARFERGDLVKRVLGGPPKSR